MRRERHLDAAHMLRLLMADSDGGSAMPTLTTISAGCGDTHGFVSVGAWTACSRRGSVALSGSTTVTHPGPRAHSSWCG
jgi:hypothetical protein